MAMSHSAFIFHKDYLKYDFGDSHVLNEKRLVSARELMISYGLIGPEGAVEMSPVPARYEEILEVHDRDYVDILLQLSEEPGGSSLAHGLGVSDNPVFRGMYGAAALQVGGTLLACDTVVGGGTKRALNIGGGFHHALPKMASGFCILNDLAIGIKHLLKRPECRRVLYLDIDAHHADGVQTIFSSDPRVLNISIHEDGRYLFPGSGFEDDIGSGEGTGFVVNVPLPPYTGDASYLYAFNEIVPPLIRSYKPYVTITQLGADAHFMDPLTHLSVSTRTYEEIGTAIDENTRKYCGERWIAVTGGGYDILTCSRVWTLMLAKMVGKDVKDELPKGWIEHCRKARLQVPSKLNLRDIVEADSLTKVTSPVLKMVERVKKKVFPYHGLN